VAHEALDLVRPDLVAAAEGRELRISANLTPGVIVRGSRSELREAIVHLLLEALDREPGEAATQRPGIIEVVAERTDGMGRVSVGSAGEIERLLWSEKAEEEPDGESEGERARIPTAPAAQSVLVIDDDVDNRAMLAAVLEAHGLRVVQAATVADAVPVDAALVDLAMPDASGWDIARALRERHPGVRLALVTGYESAATSPPEGTVDAVFPKPVDLPRLFAFLGHPAPVEAHPSVEAHP
jgi:CheY-like chemotaxis protein